MLDGTHPFAELLAKDEKAGRGAKIPLRSDLVADLKSYLGQRLHLEQQDAMRAGIAVPSVEGSLETSRIRIHQ